MKRKPPYRLPIAGIAIVFLSFAVITLWIATYILYTQKQALVTRYEEEMVRCVADSAKLLGAEKKQYAFDEIGLYAPVFEGKTFTYTTYDYKRMRVTQKSVSIDENDSWGVSVWQVDERPPIDPLRGSVDIPIFDGYENYLSHPRWMSDRIMKWGPTAVSHTTPSGIKFHVNDDEAFVGVIALDTRLVNTPFGKQVYVKVWMVTKDVIRQKSDAAYQQTVEKLKRVVDTLALKIP